MSPSPKKSLRILFATPECAPLVKTGGLGDVSAALPPALLERGLDVRVLLPGYPAVLASLAQPREVASASVLQRPFRLLEGALPSGVPLLVLDAPALFDRGGGPYQADDGEDWDDNALRFGVLSAAAALLGSAASPLDWRPDVVHCHDWPTGLAPLYLREARAPRAGSLVTVHNLAFQGLFDFAEVAPLGLPADALGTGGLEFYGRASFLKAGLVFADAINTVSPTYAREIQQEALGFGLQGVLRERSAVLHGVLNGIDTQAWDPLTDPHLAANYGVLTLERKVANKRLFKKRMGLAAGDDVPLAAIVSRLTHQKGIDLIAEAAPAMAAAGVQIAVVGTGDRALVERIQALHHRHPERVAAFIGFDESLAHLLEAGADFFLMPSRFEPCGMNQMYSQRYGTPPVVTATGGLADTVDENTGFVMEEATTSALLSAVGRAVDAYREPKRWRRLQTNGMARDFGWGPAARAYEDIYRQINATSDA